MSGAGAGHESKPKDVSWTTRDLLLFAHSIGATVDELHLIYELHPNFTAFPTFPIVLPFKGTAHDVVDFYAAQNSGRPKIPGVPDLDFKRVIDGERHMTFFKPLPKTSDGKKFQIRSKTLGVYDKGKTGSVLESQDDLVDAETGEVYTRVRGSAFFIGQGGWGGPSGAKSQSYPPPEGKSETASYESIVAPEQAHLYRLNGDYNPLHATPEPGKAMGFGGAIMHGLYSFNVAALVLLKVLGGSDPKNLKEFAARFASPVKAGDTLVTKIWALGDEDSDGFQSVRFVTQVKGGKVCLSNGRAKMKVVGRVKVANASAKL